MSDFLDLQGAKDLNTDAIHIGAVANSVDPVTGAAIDTHVNRVGGTDYTFKGMWGALGPVVMPWTSVVGGTLTQPNQAFLHPTNGNYYSWTGAYPKVVAPGTDPTADVQWVPRTDIRLRSDINVVIKRFDSVNDLIADSSLRVGQIVETISYYRGWAASAAGAIGGNRFTIVNENTGVADTGSYINLANGLQARALFPNGIKFSQFGAIPANSTTWNNYNDAYPGDDSTAYVINCLTFLQKCGTKYRDSYLLQPVADLEGNTYIVSGDNPLGCQYAGLGNPGSAYCYKMQNGQFVWNRGTSTKLFSGFTESNCYKFDLSNLNIICAANSNISASIFKIGYDSATPLVGGCLFDNVNIACGSYISQAQYFTDKVFDISGVTLADRFTMRNCKIFGWKYLYESSNPESVSFGFYDTDLTTPRDGAIFFNHTAVWSGGMNIYGCDILSLGNNVTLFKSSNSVDTNFSMPNIDIRSRFECRGTGCIFFDVDHGTYSVDGMNMLGGYREGSENTAVVIGKAAAVNFKNSTLLKKVDLGYFTSKTGSRLRRIYAENCSFEGGYPVVSYGGLTYRNLVSSGYNSGVLVIKNSPRTTNGAWGNGLDNTESTNHSCRLGVLDTVGYMRLADSSNATKTVRLPSNVFITSALVHCVAQPSPTAYIGIYINDNLVATVATSTSTKIRTDAITSTIWGIYCIGECLVSAKVLDSAMTPLPVQTGPIAYIDLTYRPIAQQYEYSTADYGVR